MFKDKNVFITGSSSGIGEALARRFAEAGARIILFARRAERLQTLKADLESQGTKVLCCEGDVTKEEDLKRAVAKVHDTFGKLDVVIANAGFGVVGKFENLAVDDYRRQFETNVFGVLKTIYATLDDLKATKGRLGIVGSVAGFIAPPGNSPYSMSKFCMRGLAMSLYFELAPLGVSVTHIAPGYVVSEIRKVDNRGSLHVHAKEPMPSWLLVPTHKAANTIFAAMGQRKREIVVTGHGKVLVWLAGHAMGFVVLLMKLAGVSSRTEPKST